MATGVSAGAGGMPHTDLGTVDWRAYAAWGGGLDK